ncbi:MAG: UDP-glucose 4-epimerase GalE [Pseudomonadota bacterium]
MKILVLGGAGYIGSHMVRFLRERAVDVVVFDNLSTGHAFLAGDAPLVDVDVCDAAALRRAFDAHGPFTAVIHFCARSLVGESVREPELYRRVNVGGAQNLLDVMHATGHRRLVFSSTAAIYGVPQTPYIDEAHPAQPVNPYGETKLAVEQLLRGQAATRGLDSVSLRYFNAAGAHPDGSIGELHEPETHLIPNVMLAAFGGPPLSLFGDDWPTPDGTCVRDYVHVNDLADAHWRALQYMETHPGAHAFNLGNGQGYSVREVIAAAGRVLGRTVPYAVQPRRAGDPPVLVADASRARRELGWQPAWTRLDDIIASAVPFFTRQVLPRRLQ